MSSLWPWRRRFWNGLVLFKYRGNKPAAIPVPEDGPLLATVSLAQRIPGIEIPNVRVADRIPDDEASKLKDLFYRFQVAMYRRFPANEDGLPPIDADPNRALTEAYTPAHRKRFPAPVRPAEYERPDLGEIAVASPYACYLERAADGSFRWDLDVFGSAELHHGLVPLGSTVTFAVDRDARVLRAERIDCELGTFASGDAGWDRAQQLALCAATTYVSIARHYCWVHCAAGTALAVATRNRLPARHALRRLLWPHVFGTHYSNHITTQGQMLPGGDFDGTFSFTHRGMCTLFGSAYERHDITVIDPRRDAARRGIVDAGFDTPAVDNYVRHFDVTRAHAARYLAAYYASDDDLAGDAAVAAWIDELEELTPNGVGALLGPAITLDSVADLVGAYIYLATVQHEILGTGLWNYQMWTDVQPARIYRNGQREPVDVYQRLVNANFLLNARRAPLLQDFSHLALDARGVTAFAEFQTDLRALQAELDAEPAACWRIEPKILEANINA